MRTQTLFLLIFFFILVRHPLPTFGQAATSEVKGFVIADTGAELSGVSVSLKNIDTGIQLATITDNSGYYRIASLSPGKYEISARLAGFADLVQSGYVFSVGSINSINLVMKVAGLAEVINVMQETPLIEPTESDIHMVINQKQIESVPLLLRDFKGLSVLVPGIRLTNEGGISVASSSTSQAVNVMIDGGDDNDDIGGAFSQVVSNDAIQEFEVITSRFKAEYGKSAGAIINAVTKSGSNNFHGTGFEFFRNGNLIRRTQAQIDQGLEKPKFDRNQFGASLGGPIVKDKTHFFVNFETLIDHSNVTLSAGEAQPIFEAMGEEFGTLFQPLNNTSITTKITHQLNSEHSFVFRYSGENGKKKGDLIFTRLAKSAAATSEWQRHLFLARHTFLISNNALNEFLFQYSYFHDSAVGVNQPNFETPADTLLAFPSVGIGQNWYTPAQRLQEDLEFKNDFSYHRQKHDLKTGFDLSHAPRFFREWNNIRKGLFFFSQDPPARGVYPPADAFGIRFGDGKVTRSNTQLGVYLQDDWRPTERLTLNLGVRYDVEFGVLSKIVFDDKFFYLLTEHPNAVCPGCRLTDDTNNLAPRLAFAFDINGKGSTVIRGGWGIFYDQTVLNTTWLTDFDKTTREIYIVAPPFGPKNIPSLDELIATYGDGNYHQTISPDLKFPYVRQASIGFARKLNENIALDVDFLYSTGHNLTKFTNPNEWQIPNDPTSCRWCPEFPYTLVLLQSVGEDNYKGLQVAIQKRFSRKLEITAHYTLGRLVGNSDWVTDEITDFSDSYKDVGNKQDMGPLKNDTRHRFVLSSIFELPARFQFSALFQAESGRPITAMTEEDLNGNGGFPDFAPGPNGEPIGRGNFRGDSTYQVDIRLSKIVRFDERDLELMFEVFNLFNTLNYGTNYFSNSSFPNFGQPSGDLATDQLEAQLGIRFTF